MGTDLKGIVLWGQKEHFDLKQWYLTAVPRHINCFHWYLEKIEIGTIWKARPLGPSDFANILAFFKTVIWPCKM